MNKKILTFCSGLLIAGGILAACTETGIDAPKPEDILSGDQVLLNFTNPSEVAILGPYLVVADSGFSADETPLPYKKGRVAIIERSTLKLKNWLETSAMNPQWVTVVGQKAFIVSSGAIAVRSNADSTINYAASDGSIDILDLNDVSKWSATINLPKNDDDDRLGAFGRLAVTANGKIGYMGSGTTNAIFEVDLVKNELVRGTDNPIILDGLPREGKNSNGMTNLRMFKDVVYLTAFNEDKVCVADAVSDHLGSGDNGPDCGIIGLENNILEGPVDLIPDNNSVDFIAVMSLANATYYVEYDKAHGRFVNTHVGTVGNAPNAIAKLKPNVYIVNSMNGSITRQNMATQKSEKSWSVLPENSNPVSLTIDDEANLIYVTLAGTHALAAVNLKDGTVVNYAVE